MPTSHASRDTQHPHELARARCAQYTNGVISMSMYALGLVDDKEACPIDELLNLRCGTRPHPTRAISSTHAQ